MYRLMRMSAILAFIGSGVLFGMEAIDGDRQLMALSAEDRDLIYSQMTNKELCRFSGVSKDIYSEIYYFEKRKMGITKYINILKTSSSDIGNKLKSDIGNKLHNGIDISDTEWREFLRACSGHQHVRSALKKHRMNLEKQPWMIKNKEKEVNQ